MKFSKIIITAFIGITLFSACEDFLDKETDNRTEIKTVRQIQDLLVNAYMEGNYGVIGELTSDNVIDNNSPDPSTGMYYNLTANEQMHDELFAFEEVKSSDQQDSPSYVWTGCYHAIAVANAALEAMDNYVAGGGSEDEVAPMRGEALLSRAFHHFILVNIFCEIYRNDQLSESALGIPYITKPETEVMVHYERGTVTGVYKKIEQDLLEGIELVSDDYYSVPKYHFNKKAAYAFATRFYLFKREYEKVIEYATLALGNAPAGYMKDWSVATPTSASIRQWYVTAESPSNFMLIATTGWDRITGYRYGTNRQAADETIMGKGPTWATGYNYHPCYASRLYVRNKQEYGVFFPKASEFFEYTDKVAKVGRGHIVRVEFSGEETLLCRAEAYLLSKENIVADRSNIDLAFEDLKVWEQSRRNVPDPSSTNNMTEFTKKSILDFYTPTATLFVKEFNTKEISPDFTVSEEIKPYLDCVLHFRRLETFGDGMRFLDLKRYGIELTHAIGKDRVETLTPLDPRWAIQIPQEVIATGMTGNNRLGTPQAGNIAKYKGGY